MNLRKLTSVTVVFVAILAMAACAPAPAESATPSPAFVTPTPTPAAGTPTPDVAATATPAIIPVLPPSAAADDESGADYVVVYSDTSRADSAMSAMMEARPGIVAETYTLSSQDIYLQLLDDLAHDQPLADVYLVGDSRRTLALLDQGVVLNAVPDHLRAVLDERDRQPLLTHHWTALTWVQAGAPSDQDLDSWWDLTRPEWTGRVVMPDPTIDERTLVLLATATQQGESMAASYLREFGHEVALDPDCPDAGWQWVKDLLSNGVTLVLNDAQVLAQMQAERNIEGVVGLCGSELWEKAERNGIALRPALDLEPGAGLLWRSYLARVPSGPHGRAALAAIDWLMGDAEGGEGYAVWYKAGFYPVRSDVPDPPGAPDRAELAARLWEVDLESLEERLVAVRDLVAPHVDHPVGGR